MEAPSSHEKARTYHILLGQTVPLSRIVANCGLRFQEVFEATPQIQ
jgi:hypothetical protein